MRTIEQGSRMSTGTDQVGWTLFPTAIGSCGLSWRGETLLGVQLPERDAEATAARISRRHAGARRAEAPGAVARLIERLTAHLAGRCEDFGDVELPLERVGPFEREVYAITRAIAAGRTRTYGEVARQLGDVALSRAVGQALGQNPWPLVVPCHRVIAANGAPGGFSGGEGTPTKLRILAIEGVLPGGQPSLFE